MMNSTPKIRAVLWSSAIRSPLELSSVRRSFTLSIAALTSQGGAARHVAALGALALLRVASRHSALDHVVSFGADTRIGIGIPQLMTAGGRIALVHRRASPGVLT